MQAITKLLLRDKVLSARALEEALHKQSLEGCDLESVLLELDLVPENVLSAYRAATYELLPATREDVMGASEEVISMLAKADALASKVLPVSFAKPRLVVAAAEPLPVTTKRGLERALGHTVVTRIATPIRIMAGLHKFLSHPLSPREQRIVASLATRAPGVAPYIEAPAERVRLKAHTPMATDSMRPTSDPTEVLITNPPSSVRSLDNVLAISRNVVDVLRAFCAFAKQFFEHVTVLRVDGDSLTGICALGAHVALEDSFDVKVPLSHPSTVMRVVHQRRALSSELSGSDADRALISAVGREGKGPAVIVPLLRSGIVRYVLYGDRAGNEISVERLPDLMGATANLSSSLEAYSDEPSARSVTKQKIRSLRHDSLRPPAPGPHSILGVPRTAPPPPPPSGRPKSSPAAQRDKVTQDKIPAQPPPAAAKPDPMDLLERLARSESIEVALPIFDRLDGDRGDALQLVPQFFPGVVWVTPNRDPFPAAREVCGLAAYLAHCGLDAARTVQRILSAEAPLESLRCAMMVALTIEDVAVAAQVSSLYSHEDAGVREAVARVFRVGRQRNAGFEMQLHALETAASDVEAGTRVRWDAVRLLGEARRGQSVPVLIQLLGDPLMRERCVEALGTLTMQDFGGSADRWQQWFHENRQQPREMWVISALLHSDLQVRERAGTELIEIAGTDFGYVALSPRAAREASQIKARRWYERQVDAGHLAPTPSLRPSRM